MPTTETSPVPASTAARVRFDSVTKSFAGASRADAERTVLRDVNLDVAPGEVIVIIFGEETVCKYPSAFLDARSGSRNANTSAARHSHATAAPVTTGPT